jgi:hypothetical protein
MRALSAYAGLKLHAVTGEFYVLHNEALDILEKEHATFRKAVAARLLSPKAISVDRDSGGWGD